MVYNFFCWYSSKELEGFHFLYLFYFLFIFLQSVLFPSLFSIVYPKKVASNVCWLHYAHASGADIGHLSGYRTFSFHPLCTSQRHPNLHCFPPKPVPPGIPLPSCEQEMTILSLWSANKEQLKSPPWEGLLTSQLYQAPSANQMISCWNLLLQMPCFGLAIAARRLFPCLLACLLPSFIPTRERAFARATSLSKT